MPANWEFGGLLAQAIAVTPVIVLTIVVWSRARRRLGPPRIDQIANPRTLAFHLGALIYLGTFALRKNGDYRLVFVLLTLPLLLSWIDHADPARGALARAGIVIVVVGLWIGALSPFIAPWDELGSWAMAGLSRRLARRDGATAARAASGATRTAGHKELTPVRILSTLTFYHPHWTGLTVVARRLAEGFVARGHSVTVLTSRHEPDLPRHEDLNGVTVVRVPVAGRVSRTVIMPTFLVA